MPTAFFPIFPAFFCVFTMAAAALAGPVYTADDVDLKVELPPNAVEPIFKMPKNIPSEKTSAVPDNTDSGKKPPKTAPKPPVKPVPKLPAKDSGAAAASSWGMYVQTPADFPKKQPPKPAPKKPVKKPKDDEDDDEETTILTRAERNQKKAEYFRETGVYQWPEYSEDELKEIDTQQRATLESIRAMFPMNLLRYYETVHFFYVTDAPEPIAKECCLGLEAMYAKLSEIFNIPPDTQYWKGKCIITAFARQQTFLDFEVKFFKNTNVRVSTAGLAHTFSQGDVLINLYYGDVSTMDARQKFIGVLVHETTHGFLHRYKSRERLPIWLEEGIAEFMAVTIVPKDKQVPLKQKHALETMQRTRSLGGLFIVERLDVWQYGAASGMVGFLLKSKQGGIGQMVRQIKNGTKWQTALGDIYGCTPEQLAVLFGNSCRVPGLQP